MLNREKINSAIELYTANEYWRDYYETAPTAACKQRVALEFYYSEYGSEECFDREALGQEEKRLENLFSRADWEHMLKYCGNNPLLLKYRKMIAQYEEDSTKKLSTSDMENGIEAGRAWLNPYWNPKTNPRLSV